jgi:uncharacterized membrane protein
VPRLVTPGSRLKRLVIGLAVGYPLLVHAAVVTRSQALTAACLGWLALLVLLPALVRGNPAAWLAAAGAVVTVALILRGSWIWLPLYAPSILADFFIAWVFGHTLFAGRVPLIERLARLVHPPDAPLDPAVVPYARRLTLCWAVLLALLGVVSLFLALYAEPDGILLLLGRRPAVVIPQRAWSLYANFLEYLIVGVFFVAEYAYRRRRFPDQPFASFFDFVRRMIAVAPAALGARGAARVREQT